VIAAAGLLLSVFIIAAPALAGECHDSYSAWCQQPSQGSSQSAEASVAASEEASVPASEEPSAEASEEASEDASEEASEEASATEDTLGGNPTPGGTVPDTAVGSISQIPATLLSLLFLGALGGMVYLRLAKER
jgi:hypothetical protein